MHVPPRSQNIEHRSSLRTVPVLLSNIDGSQKIRVNALLDGGSTLTYVNRRVTEKFDLVGREGDYLLNGKKESIKLR